MAAELDIDGSASQPLLARRDTPREERRHGVTGESFVLLAYAGCVGKNVEGRHGRK